MTPNRHNNKKNSKNKKIKYSWSSKAGVELNPEPNNHALLTDRRREPSIKLNDGIAHRMAAKTNQLPYKSSASQLKKIMQRAHNG